MSDTQISVGAVPGFAVHNVACELDFVFASLLASTFTFIFTAFTNFTFRFSNKIACSLVAAFCTRTHLSYERKLHMLKGNCLLISNTNILKV